MSCERKVKDGNALDTKIGVINLRAPCRLNVHFVGIKLPLWTWQFAGGDPAIRHNVVVGPGFLHNFASKEERIRAGEDRPALPYPEPNAASYVLKPALFALQVINAAGRFDVLVVRAAVEHQVPFRLDPSGIGVVRDLIPRQGVSAVINFYISAKLVNRAVSLLLLRADRDGHGRFSGGRLHEAF